MKDGDSANLSNQNASAYEAEANEFQIDENTQNLIFWMNFRMLRSDKLTQW